MNPVGKLSDLRVLVVDDSVDNQVLLKHVLARQGVTTDVASDGESAIEKATSQDFDVVLMDMQMPVLDGFEATRRLRAGGYRRPIIALTARALKEDVDKTHAVGCNAHLSKPFDFDELVRTLETVITTLH